MREIPSLQTLCLRAVGSPLCSVEKAFGLVEAADGRNDENAQDGSNNRDGNDSPKKKKPLPPDHALTDGGPPSTDKAAPPQLRRASRLLRSFHQRSVVVGRHVVTPLGSSNSTAMPPMRPSPCIGAGSARRANANEVDLSHPFCGCHVRDDDDDDNEPTISAMMVMEYGSPALDCLQSYVDTLVEMGRMDDARLGQRFFEEWKHNIILTLGPKQAARVLEAAVQAARDAEEATKAAAAAAAAAAARPPSTSSKKRRRGGHGSSSARTAAAATPPPQPTGPILPTMAALPPLGALSLHNASVSPKSIAAMVKSGIGPFLAVLDMSGVHGLSDDLLDKLVSQCWHLRRLSLKNCRRISSKGIVQVAQSPASRHLTCLDVGGAYNVTTHELVTQAIPLLVHLTELHASGLDWNDAALQKLTQGKHAKSSHTMSNHDYEDGEEDEDDDDDVSAMPWKALSLGFLEPTKTTRLKTSLLRARDTLVSLALPFGAVDNALLGTLGRHLPLVRALDVRGNGGLSTLTGWYDGRASADLPLQAPLRVLGRYSSLSEASIEETRRVHPHAASTQHLCVILDGTGTGIGIQRTWKRQEQQQHHWGKVGQHKSKATASSASNSTPRKKKRNST